MSRSFFFLREWVEDVLFRMDKKAQDMGAPGDTWAAILNTALKNGKLHGIAVKTPYLTEMNQQYGDPYVLLGPVKY